MIRRLAVTTAVAERTGHMLPGKLDLKEKRSTLFRKRELLYEAASDKENDSHPSVTLRSQDRQKR